MSAVLPPASELAAAPPSGWASFWRSFSRNKGALAGLAYLTLVVLCAIFADLLAPYSPIEQYRDALLSPPAWNGGDPRFWLGTDDTGRDMLSRLLHGSRLSLGIGLVSVGVALIPGIALGLAAAFFPRLLGTAILRLMDVMLALPSLLLAIAVVAVLGPGLFNTMFAIALVAVPSYVRLVRASAMAELSKDYGGIL